MFYTDEKLAEIARMKNGTLETTPYAAVLTALAVSQANAVLEIQRSSVVRSVVFDLGVPVDCRTNTISDSLGQLLVSRGRLTDEKRTELYERARAAGKRFGEILIGEGLIDAEELSKLLMQSLAKKLLGPFSFLEGQFRIAPDQPEVETPMKVKVPQLVLMGIASYARQEQVDAAVGSLVGKRLGLYPQPFFALEDLKLSQIQMRVVECLEKRQRLDELVISTGIDLEELSRLTYALCILRVVATEDNLPAAKRVAPVSGASTRTAPMSAAAISQVVSPLAPAPVVSFQPPAAPQPPVAAQQPAAQPVPPPQRSVPTVEYVAVRPDPTPSQSVSRPPAPPSPSAPPPVPPSQRMYPAVEYVAVRPDPTPSGSSQRPAQAPPPAVSSPPPAPQQPGLKEQLRESFLKAYQDYLKQDSLGVLGLEEDATPVAIQRAFIEFSRKFGPWNFEDPELSPLSSKAEELFCAGARAYAEVSDFEKFKAIVNRRRTVRTAAIKPNFSDRHVIKTDLFDTAAQFRNARNLMGQQKFREAITVLEFICDCEPENPAFRAELAWCSFLNNPVVGSQPLKDLVEVLRMDPGCGVAAFYAGEIARRTGRFDDAERFLRQAERLLPRDPRPAESLRLLPKRR
ncbi:MAG: hypothetical protein L6R30_20365 [Thermoanaerobaculia bacterium]|nr:hypothetical protein [Thermoanaerobaculia bacterium]